MSDTLMNDTLAPEEVAQKGEDIYREKLKAILEPKEKGNFVVIDVVSGDYFVATTILSAFEQAKQKYPNRLFHTIKIGYQGVFKMGGYVKGVFAYGGAS